MVALARKSCCRILAHICIGRQLHALVEGIEGIENKTNGSDGADFRP